MKPSYIRIAVRIEYAARLFAVHPNPFRENYSPLAWRVSHIRTGYSAGDFSDLDKAKTFADFLSRQKRFESGSVKRLTTLIGKDKQWVAKLTARREELGGVRF